MNTVARETPRTKYLTPRAVFSFSQGGFTLVELLAVVAIVMVLAGLSTRAARAAKSKTQGVRCIHNLRGLQMAMALYASDHDDLVVWNAAYLRQSWVASGDYSSKPGTEGCTNTQWLVDRHFASFADYIPSAEIYHCPGDKTRILIQGRSQSWVRSYGASFFQRKMNDFDAAVSESGEAVPLSMHRTFDEVHPGYLFELNGVFVQEHRFVTFPAYRHNHAGSFAFADGHVELHRWVDPRSIRSTDELLFSVSRANAPVVKENPDMVWLRVRSDSGLGYNRQDLDILEAVKNDLSLVFR